MTYKPTGRPNGRPPSLPSNLGELIIEDLKSRMDPETRMVLPRLSALVRKLDVSRSSLKRTMKGLRDNGAFELACRNPYKYTPTNKPVPKLTPLDMGGRYGRNFM